MNYRDYSGKSWTVSDLVDGDDAHQVITIQEHGVPSTIQYALPMVVILEIAAEYVRSKRLARIREATPEELLNARFIE
jgi:hypothetical protein